MTMGPMRTCLGCRQVKPKEALIRLMRGRDGRVVADLEGRGSGRGAYVCPEVGCVERALQHGRLAHAFRRPCDAGAELGETVRAAGRRASRDPPSAASDQTIRRAAIRRTDS